MTPAIPLSPQQKRQRKKNIIFISLCAGAGLAVIAFLFLPLQGQPGSTGAQKPPLHQPESAAADTATPPATAPWKQPTPGDNRAAGSATPDGSTRTADDTPTDGDTRTAYDNAPVDTSSTPEAPYTATEDDSTLESTPELTEAELAKLPPWQAALARMDTEDKQAFAVAFSKAKVAYTTEQWATCLSLLNDCDLIYDGNPNVWNLRACALLESGGLDEAEACIARSLELEPQNDVALMCQAELHMLRRDFRGSIPILEQLRQTHAGDDSPALRDVFTFHQLLCHLMLRQEMEARALVANHTPLSDSPLYYFAQAAFCVYEGDSTGALEPLRSASTIYGNASTTSYRKWMNKCGLADKYVRNRRH